MGFAPVMTMDKSMAEEAKRKLWRKYWKSIEEYPALNEKRIQEYMRTGEILPLQVKPEKPVELIGLTCGAKTRAGTPCKRRDLHINGRCRLHGGLSTGPKTEQGKKWSARNGLRPKLASKPHEGQAKG